MRYLIDTNVFTKIVNDMLSEDIMNILHDHANIIYISSESIKEFVHLVQNGKIILKKEFRSFDVFDLLENEFGLYVKYVTREHFKTRDC